MRRIAGTFAVLMLAAASTALGQSAPTRRQAPARPAPGAADNAMAAPVPDPAAMDRLLAEWARQNGTLKTLNVSFVRVDTSKAWGEDEFVGNAYLQSPNLACLHFKKVDRANPKAPIAADHERIVCTGQEVRQYDFKTKQIFVFPLDRDQRKRAIQEGPLPFLFNLNAREAKARWAMTLMGEDKDRYLVGIVPLQDRDKEVFSKAFLQLNKTTFLPDRMLLVEPNEKDTQDYRFTKVQANEPINAAFFQALSIKGWKTVVNPEPAKEAQAGFQEAPQGRPQMGVRPGAGGARAPR